jgi:hypothetical protein
MIVRPQKLDVQEVDEHVATKLLQYAMPCVAVKTLSSMTTPLSSIGVKNGRNALNNEIRAL